MNAPVLVVKQCSKCGEKPRRKTHAYCVSCWSEYQRAWRKKQTQLARDLRALIDRHAAKKAA